MSTRKTSRNCGNCNLCCIHLEIESKPGYSTRLDTNEDVAKPPGVPCRFLTKQGCGIYSVRPLVCREFICDWLAGAKEHLSKESPLMTRVIGVRGNNLHLS